MIHFIYIQIWGITQIHITLILTILIGAHLGASGHLLKEQLGLIWIHIVQDDFYWHLENARFHRQPVQLPREQREAERSSLRRHIAWETALWLWDARSQLLGLLAVSDIAQGAYEEWQTSSEGKSPELGGRRWVCYLWHLYRHTVCSPLFPPADKGIHFLYQPTDLLREVLFEKKKKDLTIVVHLSALDRLEKHWFSRWRTD